MGYSPKRKLGTTKSDPRRTKQQKLHHLGDHWEFSHLLT